MRWAKTRCSTSARPRSRYGQARVALLQAEQLVTVEKLRLFQQLGVPAPEDPATVTLSDTFPIVDPSWGLTDF